MPRLNFSESNVEDRFLNVSYINRQFREIAALYNWQSYHTPKNLAAAVAVEASELLAEFQWLTAAESQALSAEKTTQVAREVADVIMYLSEICEQLGIDMVAAVHEKININQQRFITTVIAE